MPYAQLFEIIKCFSIIKVPIYYFLLFFQMYLEKKLGTNRHCAQLFNGYRYFLRPLMSMIQHPVSGDLYISESYSTLIF